MTVDQFQDRVLAQRAAGQPWTPVTPYDFETRKAVEGIHPQLILDVFHPIRILDVGCGPGHLVRLLNERAGYSVAFGADLHDRADYSFDIAGDVPRLSADLVICREVLEHLTARQIRRAVTNLCRLSTKWVYLTTRFAKAPTSLLDFETSDDLDPTHITLLNQDLLRALFVLEGFRRRLGFEQRLDWMKQGRVLVYERVA